MVISLHPTTTRQIQKFVTVSSFTFTGVLLLYQFFVQIPAYNRYQQQLQHQQLQALLVDHTIPNRSKNTSWPERAAQIKGAFLHAYHAYEEAAYPADELFPLSKTGSNSYNGWGVSVIDSLDTIILMMLGPEYHRALKHVQNLKFNATEPIPFFETNIRYLGGLLSAYTLTLDKTFLSKAEELGDILLPAFDTPSGIPLFYANEKLGSKHTPKRHAVIAEMATFSVEFHTLAKLTGRPEFQKKVDVIIGKLWTFQKDRGLWPTQWSIADGRPANSEIAIGGNADSAYEYLLKTWMNDPGNILAKELYTAAAKGIIQNLLYLSPTRHLLYVTDLPNGIIPSSKLEHLSCFLPGVLALGLHSLPTGSISVRDRQLQLWAAEGLATTCWLTYVDHVTGLGPDEVVFSRWPSPKEGEDATKAESWETWGFSKNALKASKTVAAATSAGRQGKWIDIVEEWEESRHPRTRAAGEHDEPDDGEFPPGVRPGLAMAGESYQKKDYWLRKTNYELRPETIESLYFLWKTTGKAIWRERGWELCDSVDRHTRTPFAYSSIRRVDLLPVKFTDAMPSWFLAETLKYCYLLAIDEDLLPLDRFVFNTEAHPLPRFQWEGWQSRFGLTNP